MSQRAVAWIDADRDSIESPVTQYLSSLLLPALKSQIAVTSVALSELLDSVIAQRKLASYMPLYHLESGSNWSQVMALAERNPGIIYLHDLYHLDESLQLQTISAEAARSNIVALSNPRYVAEFSSKYPLVDACCLPLPAQVFGPRKNSEVLSICSMASLDAQDSMHRLLRTLQMVKQPFVLRWMIEASEIEAAERLLAQFGIPARLYIGKTVEQWRAICENSNYAVFLTSSVIRSSEPYPLIAVASGCSVVLSLRIYRDCYPVDVAAFVSLGVCLEYELSGLFAKYPQGCVDIDASQRFVRELRSEEFVAREIAALVCRAVNTEGSYVSAV